MRIFPTLAFFFWFAFGAWAQSPCDNLNPGFQVTTDGQVAFFHSNSSTDQHYIWDFGDGTTGNGPVPTHTYTEPGTYATCLLVWAKDPVTQDTCTAFHCETFTIISSDPCDQLSACFISSSPSTGNFFFYNCTNAPAGAVFEWDFGDGHASNGLNADHHYEQPGTYTVCLLATWQDCADSTCTTIIVEESGSPCDSLNADFEHSAAGLAVNFTNAVIDNSWTYSWDFGDGTSGPGPNPHHTYDQSGTYDVCLGIWAWNPQDQDSCFVNHCETISITGDDPCDDLAVTMSWNQGSTNTVLFTGTANFAPDGYLWDFGDGEQGYDQTEIHTYYPGTYTACFSAYLWNEQAQDTCWAHTCQTVTITGGDPCEQLQACFVPNDLGNGVFFFDNCSTGPEGMELVWDFGDGTTSTITNVDHHYEQPGTYTVCLLATWQDCADSTCTTIIVEESGSPCDSLNADFEHSAAGLAVNFTNAVIDNSWTYSWDFGDGTSGPGPNPHHTYDQSGTYDVCLGIWAWNPQDQDSCFVNHCETISITGDDPCNDLAVTMSWNQGSTNTVLFTGTANFAPDGYLWDFGDGEQGYDQSVTHTYDPGTYTACFSAYLWNEQAQDTCWAQTCQTVTITGGDPCDQLNAGFQVTTDGPVATFHSSNSTAQYYEWHFGDGINGYGPMPVHTYTEPGTYTACLLVWAWDPQTQDTCYADHCETVVITGGNPCDLLSACFEPIELPGGGYYFENCTGVLPGAQFSWDFGDGHGSNGLHAEHQYDQPGTYTVCLIADWQNCIDTTCTTVVVSGDSLCDDLAVTMSWNQGSNNSVLFTGTANFAPDGYLWDFGDGEQGYDQTVTHTYDPGTYTACFSAYLWNEQAQDTCWAHTCQTVTITGGDPCDQLNAGFQVTTDGPVATFHSSNSTAQYYEWHFGDGSIGYGPMPTHTYTGTGTYTTCLLVSAWDPQTQDSCFADHCETVVILTTGIAEGSNLDEVKTWPQPFSRALTLSGDALNGSYRVTLLDMAGRIADDRQLTINGTAQLDYRTIPPGSYILRLQGDTAVRSVRVLKY